MPKQQHTTRKRGRPKRPKAPALEALAGRKHLRILLRHRRRLRKAADHPNRTLFYDTVLTAHLLAFYNPILRSLRTIEDFSQAPQTREGGLPAPLAGRAVFPLAESPCAF